MRLGIALGGGAARGLAHVPVLEAIEERGIVPVGIAGTSIGAMMGAAYAADPSAGALRAHVEEFFRDRTRALFRVLPTRQGNVFRHGLVGGATFDAVKLMRAGLPPVPETFEDLRIPLAVVATDFYTREIVAMREGTLLDAVAGSAAIPGVIRPVLREDRVLVDGCLTVPLPFDHVPGAPDLVLASDVTGTPAGEPPTVPQPVQAMFGASQIMMRTLTDNALARGRPDILVRADLPDYRALDFLKALEILRAAEPVKDKVKRALDAHLARA